MNHLSNINRELLTIRLFPQTATAQQKEHLFQQFMDFGQLFLVADPATTIHDWNRNQFKICTTDKTLRIFLTEEDAMIFADTIGAAMQPDVFFVKKISAEDLSVIIKKEIEQNSIRFLALCGTMPIKATFSTEYCNKYIMKWLGIENTTSNDKPISEKNEKNTTPDIRPVITDDGMTLIKNIQKALSEPAAAKRREIDRGQQFENFHLLLAKLIQVNQIDPESLDQKIGLPPGYTKNMCQDLTSNAIPKKYLQAYLSCFDLLPYQYLFKGECLELSNELKTSPYIDKYAIKSASVHTTERFRLNTLFRAEDHNHAYIYKAELQSANRSVELYLSTNFNLIVGKEYEIGGLQASEESTSICISKKNSAESSATILPSEEKEQEAIALAEKKAKERRSHIPPQKNNVSYGRERYVTSPEEDYKNTILSYLIQTNGCNSAKAKELLAPLEGHPKVLTSFAKYVTEKKPGPYAIRGYTAKMLMHDLHYSPYEAYLIMAELESKPQETLQKLKYRKSDPQYQKKT